MALSAVYDPYLRLVVTEKANGEFETDPQAESQSDIAGRSSNDVVNRGSDYYVLHGGDDPAEVELLDQCQGR